MVYGAQLYTPRLHRTIAAPTRQEGKAAGKSGMNSEIW